VLLERRKKIKEMRDRREKCERACMGHTYLSFSGSRDWEDSSLRPEFMRSHLKQ
jgi:hypothetical protein